MYRSLLFASALMISGRALADQIQYLPHGPQSLSAIVTTIQNARSSVDLTYYIFEPCTVPGRLVLKNLAAKARQGVRVRAILDAQPLKAAERANLTQFFKRRGMDLKFYNDAFAFSPTLNNRSHIKFTVADGNTYVSGGRNIADGYFGFDAGINYVDRDLIVKGASARQVQASFNELWNSSMVSQGSEFEADGRFDSVCLKEDATYQKAVQMLSQKKAELKARTKEHACSDVTFTTDNPEFASARYGDGMAGESNPEYLNSLRLMEKRTSGQVLDFFSSANRRLEVENWSYVPAHRMSAVFEKLRQKQVRVEVLTNAAAAAGGIFDSSFDDIMKYYVERDTNGTQAVLQVSRQGSMNDRHDLTPATGRWKIHSKVAVADNRDVLVSSFNLDPRSYHTNLESAVVVRRCEALAKDLQAGFQGLRQNVKQDLKCKTCHPEVSPNYTMRVLGWIAHELL
ncbi:MAG: phosphatidylserine/phosphatidylglycerophosphate/cardiolipin synthase family protein [Bdellovibrionaceae bacterium]|nr:phosphatidylserine/phosphatidylglycerophosphate/cardiolipin synthase family protein [Pseudobdellovibrionaceae bacterium]